MSSRDEDPAQRLTLFFSIGRDFVVVDDGEGEWEMVEEGVIPWVSCPDRLTCAEEDGSGGGVAVTEGARARREEELVMATVPPDGCRECVVRSHREKAGRSMGTSMVGMMVESIDLQPIHFPPLYNPPRWLTFPGEPRPPPSLLTMMDKIEEVVLQLIKLVDDGMKDRR